MLVGWREMTRRQNFLKALLCVGALSCGGKSLSHDVFVESAGSSGAARMIGNADSGCSSVGGSCNAGGSGSRIDVAAGGLASGGDGPSDGGAPLCTSAEDCPPSQAPCVYATCVNGLCAQARMATGTYLGRDEPPDCHASACDANGQPVKIVDVGNIPSVASACIANACDSNGQTVSTNLPAGSACISTGGSVLCDGQGACVTCLSDSDCGAKGLCRAGACVTSGACSDGVLNGDETDIDCGGSCSPCAVTRDCLTDSDCVSSACDAQPPRRCLASHCNDHHLNGDETDVDCGGSCKGCDTSYKCLLNTDCSSGYCDPLRGNRCLSATCRDGVQDYPETDVDCGGGQCDGCALGEKCEETWDCASNACDLLTFVCIQDHCLDHRLDADETDVDCGGGAASCARCALGQKCHANSDCGSTLVCNTGAPHLCVPP